LERWPRSCSVKSALLMKCFPFLTLPTWSIVANLLNRASMVFF
jgi:hypothetical protein